MGDVSPSQPLIATCAFLYPLDHVTSEAEFPSMDFLYSVSGFTCAKLTLVHVKSLEGL